MKYLLITMSIFGTMNLFAVDQFSHEDSKRLPSFNTIEKTINSTNTTEQNNPLHINLTNDAPVDKEIYFEKGMPVNPANILNESVRNKIYERMPKEDNSKTAKETINNKKPASTNKQKDTRKNVRKITKEVIDDYLSREICDNPLEQKQTDNESVTEDLMIANNNNSTQDQNNTQQHNLPQTKLNQTANPIIPNSVTNIPQLTNNDNLKFITLPGTTLQPNNNNVQGCNAKPTTQNLTKNLPTFVNFCNPNFTSNENLLLITTINGIYLNHINTVIQQNAIYRMDSINIMLDHNFLLSIDGRNLAKMQSPDAAALAFYIELIKAGNTGVSLKHMANTINSYATECNFDSVVTRCINYVDTNNFRIESENNKFYLKYAISLTISRHVNWPKPYVKENDFKVPFINRLTPQKNKVEINKNFQVFVNDTLCCQLTKGDYNKKCAKASVLVKLIEDGDYGIPQQDLYNRLSEYAITYDDFSNIINELGSELGDRYCICLGLRTCRIFKKL